MQQNETIEEEINEGEHGSVDKRTADEMMGHTISSVMVSTSHEKLLFSVYFYFNYNMNT